MAAHEIKKRSVKEIQFDTDNPRIPSEIRGEKSLIEYYLLNDNLLDLVDSYINHGFWPGEYPVVVRENGKLVVIEGNRRLAALKLISNAELAPKEYIPKIERKIQGVDTSKYNKAYVEIAESRDSVYGFQLYKHTKNPIEPWGSVQSVKFYHRLLKKGMSLDRIAFSLNVSKNTVKERVTQYLLYQYICSLHYDSADIRNSVLDARRFPLTTLERIVSSNVGSKFFGLETDKNGILLHTIPRDEVNKGLVKVVTDIVEGKINSRVGNSRSQIEAYYEKLPEEYKPDHSIAERGQLWIDPVLTDKGDNEKNKPRPYSTARQRKVEFRASVSDIKVKVLTTELNSFINNKKIPNCQMIVFRSLLEVTLKHYLQHYKKLDKIESHKDPTLKNMIKYIVNDKEIILPIDIHRSLEDCLNSPKSLVNLNLLNRVVHSAVKLISNDNRDEFLSLAYALQNYFADRDNYT